MNKKHKNYISQNWCDTNLSMEQWLVGSSYIGLPSHPLKRENLLNTHAASWMHDCTQILDPCVQLAAYVFF
ncbi:hypothetical protein XELAEV_18047276mg [Xenopus laevis]|uniref:Uncharacterized protein n=1 Tax=Xenopus laevis TaxID=8355 RepID=A0A974BV45_XENLA|nr:hypothetical protein XELAEV_18047276mg [Xenopus laevis]